MLEKRNIFLIGPMGAGKSSVGRQLSKRLNMEFFDSDKEIEKRTGADINWVFDVEGEHGFRNREEKIIDELTKKYNIVLATGGGSVKSHITRNILSNRGIVIYLETNVEQQLIRTKKDKTRPLLKSSTIASRSNILEQLTHERNHLYTKIADISICTNQQSVKILTNQIMDILETNKNFS